MDDFNNSYMTQTPEGSNDNPYFFEPWIGDGYEEGFYGLKTLQSEYVISAPRIAPILRYAGIPTPFGRKIRIALSMRRVRIRLIIG